MTEDEAKAWITERFPGRVDVVTRIVDQVIAENARQNLVAASSVDMIWARHVVDSAQLVRLAGDVGPWIDVGTGGGFPGLIVAALVDYPVIMVEPRAKRADFLSRVVAQEELESASVIKGKAQVISSSVVAATVSARAVASIPSLFTMCGPFTDDRTRFLLPRGRSGVSELSIARETWQGMFHVEQSVTDPDAVIVVADRMRSR